jgi:predicted AlkP superfamily pyrophosphatase or phosphodiesterase
MLKGNAMKLLRRQFLYLAGLGAIATTIATISTADPVAAGNASLNLVIVLDGLRPDSITAEETPHLWRLREQGVNFVNGHSVFPTVTRANATAIATGTYPNRNGMFGNTLYVRQVDPNRAFSNGEHENLLRLDAVTGGAMVLAKSLGEILAERGKTLAVVSSGSTGSALLGQPARAEGRRRAGERLLGTGGARGVP